jgi:hypothetical protein
MFVAGTAYPEKCALTKATSFEPSLMKCVTCWPLLIVPQPLIIPALMAKLSALIGWSKRLFRASWTLPPAPGGGNG